MAGETATPCNHPGAPPDEVVDLVADAVRSIGRDEEFLKRCGLTAQDFELALPAAIQRIRGSAAAGNADRRNFLSRLFSHMVEVNSIKSFEVPDYGKDTVYRLEVETIGSVAIIQKGCPDGAHSSVAWQAPDWAIETYLWWLCDSIQYEPGEHVAKGINRLRKRFFSDIYADAVDGVIFHNATCGTPLRPCPKSTKAIEVGGKLIPPPCIWVMPERVDYSDPGEANWNWSGGQERRFPAHLLSTFGIRFQDSPLYTGYVGFQKGGRGMRTTISSKYGIGASTTYRSSSR
ncbi:hypothetical protein [Roseibium sp.]|uniref:hypothetical protein n=1 Tax=Roseibium sp. TaxID=1936156 RepID=UPI0039F05B74